MINEFVAERFGVFGILLRDEGNNFAQIVLRLALEDYFTAHASTHLRASSAVMPSPRRARQQLNLARNLGQRSVLRQPVNEINDHFSSAHGKTICVPETQCKWAFTPLRAQSSSTTDRATR
jgi:hypothetical protein